MLNAQAVPSPADSLRLCIIVPASHAPATDHPHPLPLPAAITMLCAGFEVTSLIELPPPGGIIALWAVVLPALYLLSTSITNLVLRDHTILKGPCPNCGTDNFTYFGDIFTGNRVSGWVSKDRSPSAKKEFTCGGCSITCNALLKINSIENSITSRKAASDRHHRSLGCCAVLPHQQRTSC